MHPASRVDSSPPSSTTVAAHNKIANNNDSADSSSTGSSTEVVIDYLGDYPTDAYSDDYSADDASSSGAPIPTWGRAVPSRTQSAPAAEVAAAQPNLPPLPAAPVAPNQLHSWASDDWEPHRKAPTLSARDAAQAQLDIALEGLRGPQPQPQPQPQPPNNNATGSAMAASDTHTNRRTATSNPASQPPATIDDVRFLKEGNVRNAALETSIQKLAHNAAKVMTPAQARGLQRLAHRDTHVINRTSRSLKRRTIAPAVLGAVLGYASLVFTGAIGALAASSLTITLGWVGVAACSVLLILAAAAAALTMLQDAITRRALNNLEETQPERKQSLDDLALCNQRLRNADHRVGAAYHAARRARMDTTAAQGKLNLWLREGKQTRTRRGKNQIDAIHAAFDQANASVAAAHDQLCTAHDQLSYAYKAVVAQVRFVQQACGEDQWTQLGRLLHITLPPMLPATAPDVPLNDGPSTAPSALSHVSLTQHRINGNQAAKLLGNLKADAMSPIAWAHHTEARYNRMREAAEPVRRQLQRGRRKALLKTALTAVALTVGTVFGLVLLGLTPLGGLLAPWMAPILGWLPGWWGFGVGTGVLGTTAGLAGLETRRGWRTVVPTTKALQRLKEALEPLERQLSLFDQGDSFWNPASAGPLGRRQTIVGAQDVHSFPWHLLHTQNALCDETFDRALAHAHRTARHLRLS